jgi:hypothetical protein
MNGADFDRCSGLQSLNSMSRRRCDARYGFCARNSRRVPITILLKQLSNSGHQMEREAMSRLVIAFDRRFAASPATRVSIV